MKWVTRVLRVRSVSREEVVCSERRGLRLFLRALPGVYLGTGVCDACGMSRSQERGEEGGGIVDSASRPRQDPNKQLANWPRHGHPDLDLEEPRHDPDIAQERSTHPLSGNFNAHLARNLAVSQHLVLWLQSERGRWGLRWCAFVIEPRGYSFAPAHDNHVSGPFAALLFSLVNPLPLVFSLPEAVPEPAKAPRLAA